MIQALGNLFREFSDSHPPQKHLSERDLHLVSASLMAEVMISDGSTGEAELMQVKEILAGEFQLPETVIVEIINEARGNVDQATDMFEFTDQVNRHFSDEQKFQLIVHLWEVAYADDQLNKLEEATIRKIAELIHVRHRDFIRSKHIARPE